MKRYLDSRGSRQRLEKEPQSASPGKSRRCLVTGSCSISPTSDGEVWSWVVGRKVKYIFALRVMASVSLFFFPLSNLPSFAKICHHLNVLGKARRDQKADRFSSCCLRLLDPENPGLAPNICCFSFLLFCFSFFFCFFGAFSLCLWLDYYFFFLSKSVNTPGPSPVPRIPLLPSPPWKLPVNEWAGQARTLEAAALGSADHQLLCLVLSHAPVGMMNPECCCEALTPGCIFFPPSATAPSASLFLFLFFYGLIPQMSLWINCATPNSSVVGQVIRLNLIGQDIQQTLFAVI